MSTLHNAVLEANVLGFLSLIFIPFVYSKWAFTLEDFVWFVLVHILKYFF